MCSFGSYLHENISTAQVLHPGYCGQRSEEKDQEDPRGAHHVHLKPQVTLPQNVALTTWQLVMCVFFFCHNMLNVILE